MQRAQKKSRWFVAIGIAIIFLSLGFLLGQRTVEKPCTTADCVRQHYGFSESLDDGDYSRSRWIYTNETMLHAMQFRHGGYHFSYIDEGHPYMVSIDFWNGTTRNWGEFRVSDRRCFDAQRGSRDPVGCTVTYEGNLTMRT